MGERPLIGLGQGGMQFARRGSKHLMATGEVNLTSNGMRVPVPWLSTWYDFWNGEKHEGGREITRAVDLWGP